MMGINVHSIFFVGTFCTSSVMAVNERLEDNIFAEDHIESHRHVSDHDFADYGQLLHHAGHRVYHEARVESRHGHKDEHHNQSWAITKPHYDVRDPPTSKRGNSIRPVVTKLTVFFNFIEAVNEKDGELTVSLFFKTRWVDGRIRSLEDLQKENSGVPRDHLALPSEIKERLWVPDLYIPLARLVLVPTIHQPAETIKIYRGNRVEYSAFFVIAFKCQMNYSYYPMDHQNCNLDVMSFSHTNKKMRLKWSTVGLEGRRTSSTDKFLASIYRPQHGNSFIQEDQFGKKDVLRINFRLQRHKSFHLIQTFIPSSMLVFIGWFSLLVPLDFAYGRMVLSVTTLLILVSLFVTTSQNTPGVNEVKAIDVWLFTCIFFVFSSIIDCIADLRLLSMVEKESQIAGESEAAGRVPIVDEKLRRDSQAGRESATATLAAPDSKYSVVFVGRNTPFQADKETLIASPAVIKWLRFAIFLERGMTIAYPALFVLFVAVYCAVYLSGGKEKAIISADHD